MGASARQEARQRASEERAEAARRSVRRRRLIVALVVVVALVIAGGITTAVLLATRPTAAVAAATSEGRTSPPPWAAPTDVQGQAKAAGLAMLTAEGEALHIHQHLSVTVDGTAVTVPALIGIDEAAQRISPIHTHDTSGIIHVESPVVKTFRLGQVFTEWDVALGTGRIGSYRDGKDGVHEVVFVDRKPYTGDPAKLALAAHQDIDVVVTTDGSTPAAPTKAFTFPDGY